MTGRRSVPQAAERHGIPWREREFLTVQTAGEIAGISPSSIYQLAKKGRLTLRSVAGRTVVRTKELIEFLDRVELWTPTERNAGAIAAKATRAQAAWQE